MPPPCLQVLVTFSRKPPVSSHLVNKIALRPNPLQGMHLPGVKVDSLGALARDLTHWSGQ